MKRLILIALALVCARGAFAQTPPGAYSSSPGGGGSGTTTNQTKFGIATNSSGTATAIDASIAAPSTPNGVTFTPCWIPSGGVATAPTSCWPGITVTSQTGATYTLAAADRSTCIEANNAGAQTYTIPDAGGTNFQFGYNFCIFNLGAGTITVNRTAASSFNLFAGLTGTGQTTFSLPQWNTAYFYTSPNNNWEVMVAKPSSAALSSITAATASNTIANGNNPQTWNWAQTTNTQAGMTFGETSAATNGTLTNGLANQQNVSISTASNSTAAPLNITQGSITNTVATPLAQFQTTWNNASLSGMGLLFNVTNTASSASADRLASFQIGNTEVDGIGDGGIFMFSGTQLVTSSPNVGTANGSHTWRYCFGNQIFCVGLPNASEWHMLNGNNGNSWLSVSDGTSFSANNDGSATTPDSKSGTSIASSGGVDMRENVCLTNFVPISTDSVICPDSTTHEFMGIMRGATASGMMVRRQPGAINSTGLTAAVTTATLCAASNGACNVAGQYHVHVNVWGSGTACGTPSPGGVTPSLTWTDENAVAHSAVVIPMMSQTGATTTAVNVTAPTVAFQSALANEGGSGDFTISTNGTVIQYAVAYAACGAGTGTYNIRISVNREQ